MATYVLAFTILTSVMDESVLFKRFHIMLPLSMSHKMYSIWRHSVLLSMMFRAGNDDNVKCQRVGDVSRLRIAYIEAADPLEDVEVGDDGRASRAKNQAAEEIRCQLY